MNKLLNEMNNIRPLNGAEDRMYQHIMEKYSAGKAVPMAGGDKAQKSKSSVWKTLAAAAAVVLVVGGAAGVIGLNGMLTAQNNSSDAVSETGETSETEETQETAEITDDISESSPSPVYTVYTPFSAALVSVDGGKEWVVCGPYDFEFQPRVYPAANANGRIDFSKNTAVTIFNNSTQDIEIHKCSLYNYNDMDNAVSIDEPVGTKIPKGGKAAVIVPITRFSEAGVYRFDVVTTDGSQILVDFLAGDAPDAELLTVLPDTYFSIDMLYKINRDDILAQLSPSKPDVDVRSLPYFEEYYNALIDEFTNGGDGYTAFDSPEDAEANNHTKLTAFGEYVGSDRGACIFCVGWYVPYFEGPPGSDCYYSELVYVDENGKILETAYSIDGYITEMNANGDELIFTVKDKGIFSLDTVTNEVRQLTSGINPSIFSVSDDYILYVAADGLIPTEDGISYEYHNQTLKVLIRESGEIFDTGVYYSIYSGEFAGYIYKDIFYYANEQTFKADTHIFSTYNLKTGEKGSADFGNTIPTKDTIERGREYDGTYIANERWIVSVYTSPWAEYVKGCLYYNYMLQTDMKELNSYNEDWHNHIIHVIDKESGTERYINIPAGAIPKANAKDNNDNLYTDGLYGNKLYLYHKPIFEQHKPCYIEVDLESNTMSIMSIEQKINDLGYKDVYSMYFDEMYKITECLVSEPSTDGNSNLKNYNLGFKVVR